MRLLEGALRSARRENGARVRGQIGTFVAPVLDKASQLIVAKVTIAGVEVAALRGYRSHNVLLQVGMV